MQNRDNKYELLIGEACGALGLSYQELKDKYKVYPHCLMDYIENEVYDPVIEVRFDEQLATLSFNFDENKSCTASFLFFDKPDDEDSFIEYMNKDKEYDFKKSRWMIENYYIGAKPSVYSWSFYFHK